MTAFVPVMDGFHARIVPSSVAIRNVLAACFEPLVMTNSLVLLRTSPLGVPDPPPGAGMLTTVLDGVPVALYTVPSPGPLSFTHTVEGLAKMPQGLTRRESTWVAAEGVSETIFKCVYPALVLVAACEISGVIASARNPATSVLLQLQNFLFIDFSFIFVFGSEAECKWSSSRQVLSNAKPVPAGTRRCQNAVPDSASLATS